MPATIRRLGLTALLLAAGCAAASPEVRSLEKAGWKEAVHDTGTGYESIGCVSSANLPLARAEAPEIAKENLQRHLNGHGQVFLYGSEIIDTLREGSTFCAKIYVSYEGVRRGE